MITERLSKVQVMTITVGAIFGVDILMVQHYMVKLARQDGWISLAIGGLLSIGFAFVYYLLAILHPDLDLPEIMLKLCGPFLGRLLLFPIALYAVLYAGLSARIFAQALKMFLLDRTPIYAIIGLMLVVVAYSVYKGIYVIGSISDVIFPICVFTIVSMLLMSFQQMDLDRLQPVLFENTDNVVRGIFPGFRHFLGFEIIAYVYCHTYRAKGTYKWFSAGLLIPIIFYVMLTVVSIGVFSVGSLKGLIFPTLTLSKSIEFPATFLERLGELIINIHSGLDFVLPKVEAIKDEIKSSGGAAIKNGKMVGWLTELELEAVKLMRNLYRGGVITVRTPGEEEGLNVLEVTKAKSTIKPSIKDNVPHFDIRIKVEGNYAEDVNIHTHGQLDMEYIRMLERTFKKEIESLCTRTIKRMQEEYGADVLQLKRVLQTKAPAYWKKIADQWDEIYPSASISITADVTVSLLGLET